MRHNKLNSKLSIEKQVMEQVNEIRILGEIPEVMEHTLKVLSNGLMICTIKITNPLNGNEFKKCKALIDTGAQISVICQSIFNNFTADKDKFMETDLSTTNLDEERVLVYSLNLTIPHDNCFKEIDVYFAIKNLSKRKEYKAIIGIDVLRNFDLIYKGSTGMAYLID